MKSFLPISPGSLLSGKDPNDPNAEFCKASLQFLLDPLLSGKGPSLDGMAAGSQGTWANCFEPPWRPHAHFTHLYSWESRTATIQTDLGYHAHFTHLYSWESRTLPDEKILTMCHTVARNVLARNAPFNADTAM